MSEMTNFNLDDLFVKMENDSKFESILYNPRKGERCVLVMLPPIKHENEYKLSLKVETDFKGTKGFAFIIRVIKFNLINGKPDTANPQYVGIVLPRTAVETIATNQQKGFKFATQTCHLIELAKPEKVSLTVLPQEKMIPDEIWNKGVEHPTWEELLQAHKDAQAFFAKKGDTTKTEKSEDTPW